MGEETLILEQRCWNFFWCCHYVMTVESYLRTLIWQAAHLLTGHYQHKIMSAFTNSLESYFRYILCCKSLPTASLSYCSLLIAPVRKKGESMKLCTKLISGEKRRENKERGGRRREKNAFAHSNTLVQGISDATVIRVNKTFWTGVWL